MKTFRTFEEWWTRFVSECRAHGTQPDSNAHEALLQCWNAALESVQHKLEAGEALAREVNKVVDDQQYVSPSSMTSCEIILAAALTRYRATKDSR